MTVLKLRLDLANVRAWKIFINLGQRMELTALPQPIASLAPNHQILWGLKSFKTGTIQPFLRSNEFQMLKYEYEKYIVVKT